MSVNWTPPAPPPRRRWPLAPPPARRRPARHPIASRQIATCAIPPRLAHWGNRPLPPPPRLPRIATRPAAARPPARRRQHQQSNHSPPQQVVTKSPPAAPARAPAPAGQAHQAQWPTRQAGTGAAQHWSLDAQASQAPGWPHPIANIGQARNRLSSPPTTTRPPTQARPGPGTSGPPWTHNRPSSLPPARNRHRIATNNNHSPAWPPPPQPATTITAGSRRPGTAIAASPAARHLALPARAPPPGPGALATAIAPNQSTSDTGPPGSGSDNQQVQPSHQTTHPPPASIASIARRPPSPPAWQLTVIQPIPTTVKLSPSSGSVVIVLPFIKRHQVRIFSNNNKSLPFA